MKKITNLMNPPIDFSKVTTLIFDLGGVIINLDRDACVRAYEELGVENVNELLNNYKQVGIFLELEKGEISAETFRNEIRKLTKQTITDEQIDNALIKFLLDIPQERKEMLLELRKRFRILVLSNTNPIHIPRCILPQLECNGHTVDDYFDKMYLSYEMKMAKPEPEIFEALLKDAGLQGEECLFLDDGEQNIKVAQEAGYQVYFVEAGEDWRPLFDKK